VQTSLGEVIERNEPLRDRVEDPLMDKSEFGLSETCGVIGRNRQGTIELDSLE